MTIIPMLLKEMQEEAATTRKMLERVPTHKFDWKPHEKSMTVRALATHIAELPSWVTIALTTDELDFAAKPYTPVDVADTAALLSYFEETLADGIAHLAKATESQLEEMWTMRNGEQIYTVRTKAEVIRMTFSQIVHHRAQMGVFLRLLNIPIPGSYGPTADDVRF